MREFDIRYWLGLGWLTGPIFGKELRVSSRRRRNYVLRTVYLVLLVVFITIVWTNLNLTASSPAGLSQLMADAGTRVVSMIVVFQFVALQLLAITMLSTAISDEISHQTLGVLMTTPINSFQIVMGKLLSRVFQLLVIAGITVPIVAVLRVFGGVPWSFVWASLCITVTTVLFTGALSLFFSIRSRQAHGVIIRTLLILFLIYVAVPTMIGLALQYYLANLSDQTAVQGIAVRVGQGLMLISPWTQMGYQVTRVLVPGGRAMPLVSYWGYHCLIMLGMTWVLLALAVRTVRRVALSQATGQLAQDKKGRWRVSRKQHKDEVQAGAIRRVRGACVVWKELRSPLIQGGGKRAWFGFVTAVLVQAGMYIFYSREKLLDEDFTHVLCTILFMVIGLLGSIFLSATTITSEKETRSWPILLSTPLDDWQILMGKAVGTFRRCLPVWVFLMVHVVLFVGLGYIHPTALIIMPAILVWVIVFLSGTGLYFGTRSQKTSGAVISNLALILALWLVLPAAVGVFNIFGRHEDLLNQVTFANPLFQAATAMFGLAGRHNADVPWVKLKFNQMSRDWEQSWAFLSMLGLYAGVYILAGIGFLALAKRRMRKQIFGRG
ncbi:MAG: ABC transporter permease subunit [Phycisphaerae bacterium]|nr:ABC transporter permease subunit [Phycisphaerae bacterium]